MKRVSRLALNLALLLCCAGISQAHNGKTAYAIPIADITIDGKLDDWPEEMAVYPIDWVHPTAYKPSAPDGPQDLTASFCAGFSLEANLLFLAIVVEDDYLVVHPEAPHFTNQDLSDLYVDADHSGGDIASQGVAGGEGAQQYLMVAGPSMFYLRADGNPSVAKGSTRASGVKAAFLRVGSTTVYEWSVPLFENFPDSRLQIELGQTIGFDAAVVDADGQESGDWVAWTAEGSKITDSDLYGDLVFVQDYQGLEVALGTVAPVDYGDLGTIAGIVTHIQDGTPWAGVEIEIQAEDGKPAGKAITDAEGRYQVWLLSDNYRVSLDRIERGRSTSVTLQPGMQVEHIDFAPALGLITGKVTQPNRSPMGGITVGAPMGGITVRAEDRAGAIRAEQTTTGANGSYRIWLEPGTYLLAVENPEGAEPVEVIARAGEEMGNVDFAPVGATIPTWPFTTALAILGVGVLACLMPLVRRGERLGGVLLSPDGCFRR